MLPGQFCQQKIDIKAIRGKSAQKRLFNQLKLFFQDLIYHSDKLLTTQVLQTI
ncbi:hypothetical protein TRIP_C90228 [Candidatus Zixiibacteriota bacterium]|nr:hypothetical protein TRIP_C90228 [candidate division Zixibacteria bacterium]